MGIPVSDLDDEWSDSIVVLVTVIYDNQPGKYKGVVRVSAHFSWPPFSGGDGRHIDDKLVSLLVEGGRRLKTRNVGAMAKLGLRVATEDILLCGHRHPFLSLFIIAKLLDGLREHRQVHTNHGLTMMVPDPTGINPRAFLKIELAVMIEPKMIQFFHPHFLLFLYCPLVVFVTQLQFGIVLNITTSLLTYLSRFFLSIK